MNILPWHAEPWRRMMSAAKQQRLAHGLLITGPDGVGRQEFAHALAARLLCDSPADDAACGQCRSCVLFQAGNHPDLARVEPEEDSEQIKVETIRTFIDFIHLTSQYGRYKIAVIDPADAMNRHAANTLLKTLEEPPAGSLLMLVTHRLALLPATIRSRCQIVMLAGSRSPETERWVAERLGQSRYSASELLSLARGAPLNAVEMAESGSRETQAEVLRNLQEMRQRPFDPVAVAKRWSEIGVEPVLRWLLAFLGEMACLKLRAPVETTSEPAFRRILQPLADELDLRQLMVCYETALRNYRGATGLISLNNQALLEEVVIQWQESGSEARG
ncbi:MAG: DNA polymerase III subunit delta' [Gammaproteobacteria bacterium]|nr:DNA polymerase III subunit delta' [Gammaproteobacteria bacterium]